MGGTENLTLVERGPELLTKVYEKCSTLAVVNDCSLIVFCLSDFKVEVKSEMGAHFKGDQKFGSQFCKLRSPY